MQAYVLAADAAPLRFAARLSGRSLGDYFAQQVLAKLQRSYYSVSRNDEKKLDMDAKITQELIRDSLDPTSAILLVEHERIASLYEHNVTMGDQFVAVYLAVVSTAIALLVSMRELLPQSDSLVLVELALLLIVVVLGTITFRRLIDRRIRAIEYLRAINRIHRYFVERDPKLQQYFYWPACDSCPPTRVKGTILGGLRDMVAVMNSLFLGFIVGVITRTWFPTWHYLVLVMIGVLVGLAVWVIQQRFSDLALRCAERDLEKFVLFPQPISCDNQEPA